nr:hypothetical protein [Tanacetum cinerariifolium]
GIITNIDADEDVTLKDVADIAKEVFVDAEIEESADVQGRQAKSQAQIYQIDLEHANKIMVHEPKPLKKKTQIEQYEAYVRELEVELNKNIDWDEVIEQVQRKEKEDNVVMRNMAGFKMDYFKGMTYDDIRPIFKKKFNSNVAFLEKTREQMEEEDNKALKRMSESQAKKQQRNDLACREKISTYKVHSGSNAQQFLRLDDAESINCLPNEEIIAELERMGYEKPSTKLTFYKAFLLAQWKFLIHTFLQCMSAKRTAWNEFSSSMASAVIYLATDAQVCYLSSHTTKYTSFALTQKVFANMRRVGKGFSGVDTPLFEGMLIPQQVNDDVADVAPTPPPSPHQSSIALPLSPPQQQQQPLQHTNISMELINTLLETCTTLTMRVENLEQDKIAQALEIIKLKQRVMRLEKKNKLKASGGCIQTGRIMAKIDADEDATLEKVAKKDVEVDDEKDAEAEPAELKEVIEVVTTAKLMTKVVTVAATTITVAPITAAPNATMRRKGVVIRDPEETATPSVVVHSEPNSKDKGKCILVKEPKPFKKQAHIEQDEAYARELKQAAKKQKLDEEVEELRTHLQIVSNNEDDVYTEATSLALKVPVVDYQVYTVNNKPYYKIIRADRTHQLFLSFISLLRNFDREDLEMLWQIVQERFASSKPKNFSDEFLLNTLKTLFEKPNVEAHSMEKSKRRIWISKSQKLEDDEPEPAELKEVIEVVTAAKLMTEVVTAAATTITAAPITTATIN